MVLLRALPVLCIVDCGEDPSGDSELDIPAKTEGVL